MDRRRISILLFMLTLFLTSCGSPPTTPPTIAPATAAPVPSQPPAQTSNSGSLHERLNGGWRSPIGTMVFDFTRGSYDTVIMRSAANGPLTLVSEDENTVVCRIGDQLTTIRFIDPDTIELTAEGTEPMIMTRQVAEPPADAYPYPYP